MRDYQAITTLDDLDSLVAELISAPLVAFDVETGYTSPKPAPRRALDIYHPDFIVVGFSVTTGDSWARYVPLRHDDETFFEPIEVWEKMRPVLEGVPLLAHHKKFEDRVLRGLPRQGDAHSPIRTLTGHDTMLAAYASAQYKTSGLKALTSHILGEDQAEFSSLFVQDDGKPLSGAAISRSRFNQLPPLDPKIVAYACDDVALAYAIYRHILPELEPAQMQVYNMELAISALMVEAEDYGVGVTWRGMQEDAHRGKTFLPHFEAAVREHVADMSADPSVQEQARNANFASAKQMRELLYEGLSLTTTRRTNSGEMSTDAQALEGLARKHPGIRGLLDFREVKHLQKRLAKWLDEYSGAYDGRVHPSFAQTQVVTGRFSANDPAIQQLPKEWLWSVTRDAALKPVPDGVNGEQHWAGNFRSFICAGAGRYLLLFDYGQIELRVLAGVTQEPTLLAAFAAGTDPHTATAGMMLGIPVSAVGPKERAIGKTCNFAILYGMGPGSLAERLAVPLPEARRLMDDYKSQFSKVSAWETFQKTIGVKQRYVDTWLGRRVPLWQAWSTNPANVAQAERLAVNAPIQGGASDYVKIAMLRCKAALRQRGWWGPHAVMLTMNQHDSLVFEVDNSIDPNELRALLQECVVFDAQAMFPTMRVPSFPVFEVDWEIGLTWGESASWSDERAVWDESGVWRLEGNAPQPVPDASPLVAIADEEVSLPEISLPPKATAEALVFEWATLPEDLTVEAVVKEVQSLADLFPGALSTRVRIADEEVLAVDTGLSSDLYGIVSLSLPGVEMRMIEDESNV